MNKLDNIDNKFRVFRMELLAGEPDYVVTQVCITLSALYSVLNVLPSPKTIAASLSTFGRYIGIRDFTQSMNVSSTNSIGKI